MPLELLQDSDSSLSTIAPHWSSSYPEYLSTDQNPTEQRRVVWARLHSHRANLAKRLLSVREQYLAARRELQSGTTQVESSHEPLFRDTCQPDMALVELQTELHEGCNAEVSVTTIARSLQRQGYTMKMVCCLGLLASLRFTIYKVTCPALERNEQDRQEYMALVAAHFCPDQLVFTDKSHFNRLTLRRPYVWSIRGECAQRYEFAFRGTKYSMLPVLSLDGILHFEVLENAITIEDFWQFVEGLLLHMNEWPLPNLVLIIDNAAIHKVEGIREMVEEHSSRLLYLPVYSPDLLCHGRDVHPTWVKSITETLSNKGSGFCSTRAKSEEDFDSY